MYSNTSLTRHKCSKGHCDKVLGGWGDFGVVETFHIVLKPLKQLNLYKERNNDLDNVLLHTGHLIFVVEIKCFL